MGLNAAFGKLGGIAEKILTVIGLYRCVHDFLNSMEVTHGNRVSTRNQRLAALHIFYRFLPLRQPEMLAEAQQVEATPVKQAAPP
jgi:hypothetical protein